jgi:hypothetical protein
MDYHIPFVNSRDDWSLARQLHPDSAVFRVTMESRSDIGWASSPHAKLWADTETDALHNWPKSGNRDFNAYFSAFANAKEIADPLFWSKPDRAAVSSFVNSILDNVLQSAPAPAWLSIPQLPHVNGTQRNKVNRALAEATLNWKSKRSFKGKLILPAIFTHQNQLNNKTERNGKISLVISCFEESGADGLWVVDSSLHDQDGTGSFTKRFKGIVRLHEELTDGLPPRAITVAGPYWALGLVLWARGLVQYTTTGAGRGYQYYIPGGPAPKSSNARVALAPLRRQAVWSSDLKAWLESALKIIPKTDAAHQQFSDILNQFLILRDKKQARSQVANFYKEWLKKFEAVPVQGRPLALYQDFSSAYVLGKTFDDIPDKVLRNPSRLAEQFMMICL